MSRRPCFIPNCWRTSFASYSNYYYYFFFQKRLNEDHKLVQFELSRDHDGIVLIFIDDLKDHIQHVCGKNELIEKFINKILMQISGFGIDREQLFKILKIKEKGAR